MRHLGSILLSLVLAAGVYVLVGIGSVRLGVALAFTGHDYTNEAIGAAALLAAGARSAARVGLVLAADVQRVPATAAVPDVRVAGVGFADIGFAGVGGARACRPGRGELGDPAAVPAAGPAHVRAPTVQRRAQLPTGAVELRAASTPVRLAHLRHRRAAGGTIDRRGARAASRPGHHPKALKLHKGGAVTGAACVCPGARRALLSYRRRTPVSPAPGRTGLTGR